MNQCPPADHPDAPSLPRRAAAGFTLVELLTVVTIIVILAGLTVGGLSFYNRRQAEDKTRVQLKLLANACEEFKYDYGMYPPLPNKSTGKEVFTTAAGKDQTYKLWTALFGDTDNDGQLYDVDEDQTSYLADLDPDSNNQGWITGSGNNLEIDDGFGHEYRYRKTSNAAQMRNPDFDLWSQGADGETDTAPNTTHKDTRDDIWN